MWYDWQPVSSSIFFLNYEQRLVCWIRIGLMWKEFTNHETREEFTAEPILYTYLRKRSQRERETGDSPCRLRAKAICELITASSLTPIQVPRTTHHLIADWPAPLVHPASLLSTNDVKIWSENYNIICIKQYRAKRVTSTIRLRVCDWYARNLERRIWVGYGAPCTVYERLLVLYIMILTFFLNMSYIFFGRGNAHEG